MKNMGIFDPSWKPVIPGGLSDSDKKNFENLGWKHEVTYKISKDVDIGFADNDVPGGFSFYKFDVPEGTPYMYNPRDGRAVISGCGNPTCWRWLT